MFERYKDIVTVKDLAEMLCVGRNKAYEMVRADIIPNIKIGRQVRISKEAIIEYIHRQNKSKHF